MLYIINEEEFEEFHPRDKFFYLGLDKYTCCKKKCGECFVNEEIVKKTQKYNNLFDETLPEYCPEIIKSILDKGFCIEYNPITVTKYVCGHYSVDDGRHRICATAKMNMTIKARVKQNKSLCWFCSTNKGFNRIINCIKKNKLEKL